MKEQKVYDESKIRAQLVYKGVDTKEIRSYFRNQYNFPFNNNKIIENDLDFIILEQVVAYINELNNKDKQEFLKNSSNEYINFCNYQIKINENEFKKLKKDFDSTEYIELTKEKYEELNQKYKLSLKYYKDRLQEELE